MAPASPSQNDQTSPLSLHEAFTLLSLPPTATPAEIRKSYRTLSLKLHPDKAGPTIPAQVATDRFSALHRAYELLSDPVTREKLAREAKEEEKRRERVGKFEEERRRMVEELAKREGVERERREGVRRREREVERLRGEGRRLREEEGERRRKERVDAEEAMRKERAKAEAASAATASTSAAGVTQNDPSTTDEPPLGPLDTTVRLLYPISLSDRDPSFASSLQSALTKRFGPLLHFKVTPPPPATGDTDSLEAGKKRKRSSAEPVCLATFEDMGAALRLVETGSDFRLDEALREQTSSSSSAAEAYSEVWVEWAAAKEAQQRKRREAKKAAAAAAAAAAAGGDATNGGSNGNGAEQSLPPGSRIGEPERVTFWRQGRPERLEEALKGGTTKVKAAGPPASSTTATSSSSTTSAAPKASTSTSSAASFEQDVLKRAMAAAEAKKRKKAQEEAEKQAAALKGAEAA